MAFQKVTEATVCFF